MLIQTDQSIVLLIDLQQKLMPAMVSGSRTLRQCALIAGIAEKMDVPVITTEQEPAKLGNTVEAIRALSRPALTKHHFDACPAGLIDGLPEGRQHIVVGGCETHICVLQTALSLVDAGYKVWVLTDGTSARSQLDHETALGHLQQSGARLATAEMLAFQWLGHSHHVHFRAVQSLIKANHGATT